MLQDVGHTQTLLRQLSSESKPRNQRSHSPTSQELLLPITEMKLQEGWDQAGFYTAIHRQIMMLSALFILPLPLLPPLPPRLQFFFEQKGLVPGSATLPHFPLPFEAAFQSPGTTLTRRSLIKQTINTQEGHSTMWRSKVSSARHLQVIALAILCPG